jgi:hypothetical protein
MQAMTVSTSAAALHGGFGKFSRIVAKSAQASVRRDAGVASFLAFRPEIS